MIRAVTSTAALLMLLATPALACRCDGCGCKGGPGWRGPDGHCVSKKKFAKVCGSPPGKPCSYEGAKPVCDKAEAPARSSAPRTRRPDPPERSRPVDNPFGQT